MTEHKPLNLKNSQLPSVLYWRTSSFQSKSRESFATKTTDFDIKTIQDLSGTFIVIFIDIKAAAAE